MNCSKLFINIFMKKKLKIIGILCQAAAHHARHIKAQCLSTAVVHKSAPSSIRRILVRPRANRWRELAIHTFAYLRGRLIKSSLFYYVVRSNMRTDCLSLSSARINHQLVYVSTDSYLYLSCTLMYIKMNISLIISNLSSLGGLWWMNADEWTPLGMRNILLRWVDKHHREADGAFCWWLCASVFMQYKTENWSTNCDKFMKVVGWKNENMFLGFSMEDLSLHWTKDTPHNTVICHIGNIDYI